MTTSPDAWVYGDFAPDPSCRDLIGLKARWLLECLPPGESPRVLDYGVGEGKHLRLVRKNKPRARLVGVDVRAPHSTTDFEFHRVASDLPLPFADESFDLVISCDVLVVESIEKSLDEIRRVLRGGGSFIGFVPAEGGLGAHAIYRFFSPDIFRDTKDHVHAYTRRELLGWFGSRFLIERVAYSYHLMGAFMDATFFAAFKLPGIGARLEKFWRSQENALYRVPDPRRRPALMGRLIRFANLSAYWESRFLKNFAPSAKGLHFHLVKPP